MKARTTMRLSLILFAASCVVSILLTAFSDEVRTVFKPSTLEVVIDEAAPDQYLTMEDATRVGTWVQSIQKDELSSDSDPNNPSIFYNTYYITNSGTQDIVDGVVEYDSSFSTDGLIGARVRSPLPSEPVGQIEPRRHAWNEFTEIAEGKFGFQIPLLRPAESVTVVIIADEFGAVTPTFRAPGVKVTSRLSHVLEYITNGSHFDWIKLTKFLSILVMVGSVFYLGRFTTVFDVERLTGIVRTKIIRDRRPSVADKPDDRGQTNIEKN